MSFDLASLSDAQLERLQLFLSNEASSANEADSSSSKDSDENDSKQQLWDVSKIANFDNSPVIEVEIPECSQKLPENMEERKLLFPVWERARRSGPNSPCVTSERAQFLKSLDALYKSGLLSTNHTITQHDKSRISLACYLLMQEYPVDKQYILYDIRNRVSNSKGWRKQQKRPIPVPPPPPPPPAPPQAQTRSQVETVIRQKKRGLAEIITSHSLSNAVVAKGNVSPMYR